jgi:modification methylase
LEWDGKTGSIHGLGKELQGAPSCNGWTFWHYETGASGSGVVQPIDAARQLYLLASED